MGAYLFTYLRNHCGWEPAYCSLGSRRRFDFVNMPVLTKEDRILISELNTLKGFGAKKLINEFPSKGWKVLFD